MRLLGMRILAAAVSAAMLFAEASATFAQSADPKAGASRSQNGEAEGPKKAADEFAGAAKVLGGPAANPEWVWLGRRVVNLLWRDDLDTAFRHLDLYHRFGCPSGHIQATFRWGVRQGSIDPKAPEGLAAPIQACWVNPALQTPPTTATTTPQSSGTS